MYKLKHTLVSFQNRIVVDRERYCSNTNILSSDSDNGFHIPLTNIVFTEFFAYDFHRIRRDQVNLTRNMFVMQM